MAALVEFQCRNALLSLCFWIEVPKLEALLSSSSFHLKLQRKGPTIHNKGPQLPPSALSQHVPCVTSLESFLLGYTFVCSPWPPPSFIMSHSLLVLKSIVNFQLLLVITHSDCPRLRRPQLQEYVWRWQDHEFQIWGGDVRKNRGQTRCVIVKNTNPQFCSSGSNKTTKLKHFREISYLKKQTTSFLMNS